MEDTPREIKEVHVLRHSFRPSQSFAVAIENFMEPGSTLPRLLLYGTKEVAVNVLDYHGGMFRKNENDINRQLEAIREPIYINSEMHFKQMGHSALRIGFLPAKDSEPAFQTALAALDEIPSLLPPFTRSLRYFMYTDIPAKDLLSLDKIEERFNNLKKLVEGEARELYTVKPDKITGTIAQREVLRRVYGLPAVQKGFDPDLPAIA